MDWGWVGVHSLPFTITRATGPVQNSQGLAYRVAEEVEALRLPGTRALSEHGRRQAGKVQWHAAAKGTAAVACSAAAGSTVPGAPSSAGAGVPELRIPRTFPSFLYQMSTI